MSIKIQDKSIGYGYPTFIIAEMSANHNQNYGLAVETLIAAKESGADAIKLQTYTPDTITIDSKDECFKIQHGTKWDGKYLYDLYKEAYTPWEWQPKLKKLADELGIILFSSPFDPSSVDFLEKMDVPAYKIASYEITDIPLIKYVASKGKPVLISTGIADLNAIIEAVEACRSVNNNKIILLKCTSAYPAPFEELDISMIPFMSKYFEDTGILIGMSDHTMGKDVAISAVALGARVIEKHFTLARSNGGPDGSFSMEPHEFKSMVESIRNIEKALGTTTHGLRDSAKSQLHFTRSLFVVESMKKGETFNLKNIRSIRPGNGLHPRHLYDIIGKQCNSDINKGTPLNFNLIDEQ